MRRIIVCLLGVCLLLSTVLSLALPVSAAIERNKEDELLDYISEQIALIEAAGYYCDGQEKQLELLNKLETKKTELKGTVWDNLPTMEALAAWIKETVAEYRAYVPIKNAAHNVSMGMDVSANLAGTDPLSALNDGDLLSHASTQAGTAGNPGWLQIDLGEVLALEEIFVLCYNADERYYRYNIYTSEDGFDFTLLAQKTDDISDKTSGGNWFYAGSARARYVRVVYVSNSKNNGFHLREVQVYARNGDLHKYLNEQLGAISQTGLYYGEKLSLAEWLKAKKAMLAAADAEQPTLSALQAEVQAKIATFLRPLKKEDRLASKDKDVTAALQGAEPIGWLNDGDLGNFASVGVNGWLQIDLGEVLALEEVYVLCYHSDARYYHYEIYTSADGIAYTLLADKKDAVGDKASGGNWFDANGTLARYVRIVGVLNSMSLLSPDNSSIHISEMQIYVADADYSAVDAAVEKVPKDLSVYTNETVQALKKALAAVKRGKSSTEQATVDGYAQAIEAAIALLVRKPPPKGDKPIYEQTQEETDQELDREEGEAEEEDTSFAPIIAVTSVGTVTVAAAVCFVFLRKRKISKT